MSNVLECRAVEKTYVDGERKLHILRGVDLAVPEGKSTAITGASGAGKSTLLHLMGTLDHPTAGEILLRDEPLSRYSREGIDRARNQDIGFVFQFYHLLPEFSALENVMMPGLAQGKSRARCRARAEELLDRVGLAERVTHKPGQLSGGEQQRVAIARALYNAPAIVLADEPTGNLDEETGAGIVDLIWSLNRSDGITLVLVTHDLDIARQADQHVRLHDGKVETFTAQRS